MGVEVVADDASRLLFVVEPLIDVGEIVLRRPVRFEVGMQNVFDPVGIDRLHRAVHLDEGVERRFDRFGFLGQRGFTTGELHDDGEVLTRTEPFDIGGVSAVTVYGLFELVARALSKNERVTHITDVSFRLL